MCDEKMWGRVRGDVWMMNGDERGWEMGRRR